MCRWHEICPGLGAHDLSGLCRRDRMLPEVRMARIIDAIGLHQARKLSCVEAAELLVMSKRHFRRLRDAYEERGAEGIADRRRGRASGRRAPVDEVAWVVEAFRIIDQPTICRVAKSLMAARYKKPSSVGSNYPGL